MIVPRKPDSVMKRLVGLGEALIAQEKATMLVEPERMAHGYWFGSGNISRGPHGEYYLTGRYRSGGDSRTGVGLGERGRELAIFRSEDGESFTKLMSFSKEDLGDDLLGVISIEGSSLHFTENGVELFVSTEKRGIDYPEGFREYQKSGSGVWTIDRFAAPNVSALRESGRTEVLRSVDPEFLHVKDPSIVDQPDGSTLMFFCTHPFDWASCNTAVAIRSKGTTDFQSPDLRCFPRGTTWDAGIARITAALEVPRIGALSDSPVAHLLFYDGGESMHEYDEHPSANRRPRGLNCENLGGLAVMSEWDYRRIARLSPYVPMFVSPYGTGSSRYVQVFASEQGIRAIWQQSQPERAQALVTRFLPNEEVARILA